MPDIEWRGPTRGQYYIGAPELRGSEWDQRYFQCVNGVDKSVHEARLLELFSYHLARPD
jgi:hypothetical protein